MKGCGSQPIPSVKIALFPSDLLATSVALAFQHFVDAALVDAEAGCDLVLIFAVPAVKPDLYGVVEGEAMVPMLHFLGSFGLRNLDQLDRPSSPSILGFVKG